MTNYVENDARERREALRLSRGDLAVAAGVSVGSVYTYERGGNPTGGQATIEKIEGILDGEKGGAVSTETKFSVGDVVSGTVNDEDLLLKVKAVSDTTVTGTQLVQYDLKGMRKSIEAGGFVFKFRGRNYLLHHARTLRLTDVTGHWAMDLL